MKLYITTRVDGKFQPVTDADALAELQRSQPAPITDADITAAAQSARSMHTHHVAAQLREQRCQIAGNALADQADKARSGSAREYGIIVLSVLAIFAALFGLAMLGIYRGWL